MNKKNVPIVCIINGPPGSGKSTISLELCKLFNNRAKVVSVDNIRSKLYHSKILESTNGLEILNLSTHISAKIVSKHASSHLKHKIILLDDCITRKSRMEKYKKLLNTFKITTILLLPSAKVQKLRDAGRNSGKFLGNHAMKLRTKIKKAKPHEWHDVVIDNSSKSINETAKIIKNIIKLRYN